MSALAITAIGMMTPAGGSAGPACAAIRANFARFFEASHPLIQRDGADEILKVSAVSGVTSGTSGLGRLVRLASSALSDLVEGAALTPRDVTQGGLYVALAEEGSAGADPRAPKEIGARIERACDVPGLAAKTKTFPLGHAGAIAALAEARDEIAAGRAPSAIVGGVDSLLAAETLHALHAAGRLKTEDRAVGLIPGEAAAFVRVEPVDRARARGAAILATIDAPSTAREPVTIDTDDPCDATGLTTAVRKAIAGGGEIGIIASDVNGEVYRSEELSYLIARAFAGKPSPRVWHPASSIGDTGAASAAVGMVVLARAMARGYAETRGAIVVGSSDRGLRGCAIVRTKEGT